MRDTDGPFGKYVSLAYWLIQKRLNTELTGFGIKITQYSILRYLYKHDGSNQEQIARDLEIDKGLCSREIRKLEEAGLITRTKHQSDNRQWICSLTESVLALKPDLVRIGDQVNENVLSGLSSKEEKVLYTLIKRVISNLDTGED
ncbi:MAG TPA: MarR family transcriptional regulator [Methanospirillum sp.]|uniref:MarR family winged helix-turn-helix transcriptional regulator n=1 Tax=Methanospirillum sp. TaxID=45200 RepID=UPI002BED38BE|nr:MarR family transcriptional regulator [Methanospirillum sp.]HWQ63637.1 MarR family transcriptional regulator [Methanospirillum sp.]